MAWEQYQYNSGVNTFNCYIDNEGQILESFSRQIIGINDKKRDDILADCRSMAVENAALENRLKEIEDLLERHKDSLPDDLRKIIQKPPSVESLQVQMTEMKQMMATMAALLQERSANDNNNGSMSALGPESKHSKSGRAKVDGDGNKPEQP